MFAASRPVSGGALRRPRTHFGVLIATIVATLACSAPAAGAISITKLAAGPIPASTHCNPNITPEQMQRGAALRSDFCLAFYTSGGDPATGDDMKSVRSHMPQGFLATADTSPNCTKEQFMPDRGDPARCPANSQIGSVEAVVRVSLHGLVIPQTVHGKVWNIKHGTDEVAVIGIELETELGGIQLPHNKLLGRTTLRPNPDVGLITVIDNQPRMADLGSALGKHPLVIDGFFLRLWGSKADHPSLVQSFGMMGSDCSTDQVSRMLGTTYSGATTNASDSYRLTDCDKVPLQASTSFSTAEKRPDVPTGATVVVRVDQERDPHFQGNLRKTVMTLPAGITMGPQVATGEAGLPLCTAAQFGWDQWGKANCPAGSRVADVSLISPLQANHFDGAAYLGEQPAPGEMPQLFIEGGFGDAVDAPRVKLRGTMKVNDDGQIVTTLDNLPQVSFQEFRLTFRGGQHAPLVTPRQCGTTSGSMVSTPASGRPDIVQPISLTIDEDCIDPAAFTPSIDYQPGSTQAGARAPLTVITERPDRTDRITTLIHDLPAGIVSDLKLATECTAEQAAAQACPDSSRIGTQTSTAGVGPAPATVKGGVYLGETQPGDVASIIITAPVEFGDVKLGYLNVPASITLRPEDQGLHLTAKMPTTFKGIPLNLRRVAVTLDREGFAMNPTSCQPLSGAGTLTSEHGQTVTLTDTVQMTGCERLGFEPTLGFAIDGKIGVGTKPTVKVSVGLPAGGSNMKSTVVAMPYGIAADIKQVQRACTLEAWNAGTCGDDPVIGTVAAKLAITNEQIPGTLSLVRVPTEVLPGIGIQLQGRFATRILGKVAMDTKTGQMMNRFESLPDVPLSQLDLTIGGGPRSPLVMTKSLCADGFAVMTGTFTGHAGAVRERKPQITCPPAVAGIASSSGSVKVSGTLRRGLTVKVTPPPSGKVSGVRFSLPSGVTVKSAQLTSKKRLRGASSVAVSSRKTLSAVLPKGGRESVALKLPKGALQFTKAAGRRSKWTVSFRVSYASGKTQIYKVAVKR